MLGKDADACPFNRFYKTFKTREPLQIDGVQVISFGTERPISLWPFGFKFACSLSHRLGEHVGHLKIDCTSQGDDLEQISGSSWPVDYAGGCRGPSDVTQCIADACYHGELTTRLQCKTAPLTIKEEPPLSHRCLIERSESLVMQSMKNLRDEAILRQDISELCAQRSVLRSKASSSKISACPWLDAQMEIREDVSRHIHFPFPLTCSLLYRVPELNLALTDERESNIWKHHKVFSGLKKKCCQVLDMSVQHIALKSLMELDNCKKSVSELLFCNLKRKGLKFATGSRKKARTVKSETQLTRSEQHLQDRQQRERERESDRLGRLLRRAAELDVSRCCNDIRTLLLARGQCEEASLNVCAPPSVDGQLPPNSFLYSELSINNSSSSRIKSRLWPMPLQRPSIDENDSDYVAFRVTDFLTVFAAPLKPYTSPLFTFLPSGLELSAALKESTVETNVLQIADKHLLNRVASTLVQGMLPNIFRLLGLDKTVQRIVEILPLNLHVWPSLARLCFLMCGYRELGLADIEILSEIHGVESWSVSPDLESTDYCPLSLLRACPVLGSTSICTINSLKKFHKHYVRIPAPSGGKKNWGSPPDDYMLHGETNHMPTTLVLKTDVSTIALASDTSHGRNKYHSSVKKKAESNLTSSTCLAILASLIPTFHKSTPECPELYTIYWALCDVEAALLSGQHHESFIAFAGVVRHILSNKGQSDPGESLIESYKLKLLSKFENLVLEHVPFQGLNVSNCDIKIIETSSNTVLDQWPRPARNTYEITLCCQYCGAFGGISCCRTVPFLNCLALQPHSSSFFCFSCYRLRNGLKRGHLIKFCFYTEHSYVNGAILLCNRGEVRNLASDVFVSPRNMPPELASLQLNSAFTIPRTLKLLTPDLETLLCAIAAISRDSLPQTKDSWLCILTALVNSAALLVDMQSVLSAVGSDGCLDFESKGDSLSAQIQVGGLGKDMISPRPVQSFVLQRRIVPSESETLETTRGSAESPVARHEMYGETCPLNVDYRKQREAYLVSGVIEAAADSLQKKYDVASEVMFQISLTALKGTSDLASCGMEDVRLSEFKDEVVVSKPCTLCGGDYDYLSSTLKYCDGFPQTSLEKDGGVKVDTLKYWGRWAREMKLASTTHQFCVQATSLSRCLILKKMRQSWLRIQSEVLELSGGGRMIPIGIDQAGRLYWRFGSSSSSLHIQTPCYLQDAERTCSIQKTNHAWSCYDTLPAIAQIINYLAKTNNDHADALRQIISFVFPELALMMPEYIYLDVANVFVAIETALQLRTNLSINAHSDYICATAKSHHDANGFIFVRMFQMLWYARIINMGVCHEGNRLYQICYYKWSDCFDSWVSDEHILFATPACDAAQKYLYDSRMIVNAAHSPGSTLQSLNLVASKFIGMSCRINPQPPASIFFASVTASEIVQIRAAIMIVEAALPIGAKVDWSREKTCARIRELEESTTPIELIELVLMLEDELSLSWLDTHWTSIRACIPTRLFLLQHPACSWAALLIWLLDSAIIYEKVIE